MIIRYKRIFRSPPSVFRFTKLQKRETMRPYPRTICSRQRSRWGVRQLAPPVQLFKRSQYSIAGALIHRSSRQSRSWASHFYRLPSYVISSRFCRDIRSLAEFVGVPGELSASNTAGQVRFRFSAREAQQTRSLVFSSVAELTIRMVSQTSPH